MNAIVLGQGTTGNVFVNNCKSLNPSDSRSASGAWIFTYILVRITRYWQDCTKGCCDIMNGIYTTNTFSRVNNELICWCYIREVHLSSATFISFIYVCGINKRFQMCCPWAHILYWLLMKFRVLNKYNPISHYIRCHVQYLPISEMNWQRWMDDYSMHQPFITLITGN